MTEQGYYEYERCKKFIRGTLDTVYPFCDAASTIAISNMIYGKALSNAKRHIFKTVKHDKEEVVNSINNYYFGMYIKEACRSRKV